MSVVGNWHVLRDNFRPPFSCHNCHIYLSAWTPLSDCLSSPRLHGIQVTPDARTPAWNKFSSKTASIHYSSREIIDSPMSMVKM